MDATAFLEFKMLEFEDSLVDELKRFTKFTFDEDSTVQAATELKYTGEIKRILAQQLREPTDEFVKLFASQIYSGLRTKAVIDRFSQLTRQALNEFINDRVYDRLKSAMSTEGDSSPAGPLRRLKHCPWMTRYPIGKNRTWLRPTKSSKRFISSRRCCTMW